MARVLLTGGSGFIGEGLLRRLLDRGDDVVALARSDASAAALRAHGAEVARGDVLDEASLTAAMRGTELVCHVAGINTMCPADPMALFQVNVRGADCRPRRRGAGVGRFVLTSSAAALGEAHGTVGTEDSPHRGEFLSVYERTKHEGERVVLLPGGWRASTWWPSTRPPSRPGSRWRHGADSIAYSMAAARCSSTPRPRSSTSTMPSRATCSLPSGACRSSVTSCRRGDDVP